MIKYILPFLTSFIITVIFVIAFIRVGKRVRWQDRQAERHIHRKNVFRLGGVAMILAFNLAILLNKDLVITPDLAGMMLGSLVLMVVGFWDDVRELSWKTQLFYQIAVAGLVFAAGVRIYYVAHPLTGEIVHLNLGWGVVFSLILVVGWIVLAVNAMNWADGADGLAGGVTFIGALTIFFLSLKPEVNQPPMAILSMILAGAALGFLVFNYHPAKIVAGTAGSMFLGFALAVLAIFAGTKIATALLIMTLPVLDFVWVIGERISRGTSIFQPDTNHLHYKLLDLGWSQKMIALYFYSVTALVSIVALNTRVIGKSLTFLIAGIIMATFLIFIKRKIKSAASRTKMSAKGGSAPDGRKVVIIAFIVVLIGGGFYFLKKNYLFFNAERRTLDIKGRQVKIEIASTEQAREKGLSGRKELCSDCAMLFVFPQKGGYSFWMKDMLFDLDMVWIADNRVARIDENVPHIGGASNVISPGIEIDKVLEFNAGFADRVGLQEGDRLNLKN